MEYIPTKEIKVFWEIESKRIPELQKPDWLDDKWQLPVDEYEFCFNDDMTWDDEEIKVEFAEHKSAYDRIPFLGCEYHKKHLWALSTLLNITAVYDSKIDSLVCSHAYGWAFLMRLKEEGEK